MIYSIPNMNLNESLKFSGNLNKITPDNEMIFDFSEMHQFDPLPILMMGLIIRDYRLKYPDIPFKVTWCDYTGKGYVEQWGSLNIFQKN